MNELPPGWARVPLGSVIRIRNGYAFKSADFTTSGVPLIRQSNLTGQNVDLTKCAYLPEHIAQVSSAFIVHKGDILIGMSGSIGEPSIYQGEAPALQNQRTGLIVFRVNDLRHRAFIRFFLRFSEREYSRKGKGIGVQNVSASDIESIEVPLPPLLEQRRIVAKLTTLLNRSGTASEELARIPRLVERYKKAILVAVMETDETGQTWPCVPLAELLTEGPTNGYSPRSGENPTGTLSLKLTATTRGVMDLSDRAVKRLNEVVPKDSKFWLRPGDILIQRANSLEYVGIAAIYDGPPHKYIYPDLMIRIRVASPAVGRWIWRYCSSVSSII